jgi:predicted AlkP superfamily pyrophosphatase or phosphodiesterase
MVNMNKKTKSIFILTVFTALVFSFIAGCASTKQALRAGSLPPDFVPVKHLVFIGLDGWGGAYVPKANMPTVKRMMANGAWTLDARCIMPSISWPNWSTLFYGTPPEKRDREDFTSIFTLVQKNERTKKSIFFYEWDELLKLTSIDTTEKQKIHSDIESAEKIAAYIKEQKPVFTAMNFNEPDNTGHDIYWGSKAYYAICAEMDNVIAIIEQAYKDAGIYDNTVFVLSADHGGSFDTHVLNFPINRKIPMIFYGCGIKEGFTLPGRINNYDITPTMAALLGLDIPPEWTGRILYEIFK